MFGKLARKSAVFVLAIGVTLGGQRTIAQPVDTAQIDSGSPKIG